MDYNKEETEEIKHYTYIHQAVTSNVHHFYISSSIEDPIYYTDMVHKIMVAAPNDIIYIHLATPGGYVATGIQLINAMNASQAHVIAALEGEVASLGTMLFLAADEFIVHDNCLLMFHNYSGGVWGKGHEQVAALESATRWSEDFMMRLYVPFMTKDEVERLIKGEDIYMHPPEIKERLAAMVKIRQEEADAEAAAEAENPKPKRKRRTKK